MFAAIGQWEIVLIVLAILLLFGGRKIPELARGLGSGIREFQQGMRGGSKPGAPPEGGSAGDNGPKSQD